jgi:hypothetical protein
LSEIFLYRYVVRLTVYLLNELNELIDYETKLSEDKPKKLWRT